MYSKFMALSKLDMTRLPYVIDLEQSG